MSKSVQKIMLSASRDIPFSQLVLSQSNVRQVKAGVSIEELAEDIARRTLLQSITVRPVLDETGAETGKYEIPAGGRRYRALELLVKQKRLSKTAPIPCVVRTDGIAEEDSLAENIQRAPLHPLDQFRAFQALREKGQSEEEIAAAFFVSVAVVKQRLRLAAVSPKLHDAYTEDQMTLDQLMAFTVNPDHERQEQVWEAIQRGHNRQPQQIRRFLTEDAVRVSDKRALYAGAAYIRADGAIMRDLFQQDDGGWLQDVGLLDRLVSEKIEQDAETVRAEGWKWVEVAIDFPYGHTYGLRQIAGQQPPLSEEDTATVAALQAEAEEIEAKYAGNKDLPEEADQRMSEIEAALAAIEERPAAYDPADVSRSGAFISIDGQGKLRVERGFVQPEDEPPVSEPGGAEEGGDPVETSAAEGGGHEISSDDTDEADGIRPLPDRLMMELTAYRTLALRDAVGSDPSVAFLAMLHVLCLRLFYRYGLDSCLEVDAKTVAFGNRVAGLSDTALASRIDARHRYWLERLPEDAAALWETLAGLDTASRQGLFAHCVSLTVNAVYEAVNRRPKALAHADKLAEAVCLDMAASWSPTADNYFGRVTKARILEAVREAQGEDAAHRIEHLKKSDMATEAERLLTGSGWLPEPLRTGKPSVPAGAETLEVEAPNSTVVETAVAGQTRAIDADAGQTDSSDRPDAPHALAAE